MNAKDEILVSFRKKLICSKCNSDFSKFVDVDGFYKIYCECGNVVQGWGGKRQYFAQESLLCVWKYFWFNIDTYIPPEIKKQIINNEQLMNLPPLEHDAKAIKPAVKIKKE